jgi:RNA polymerase sigma-70 factor (ECF subfamily)
MTNIFITQYNRRQCVMFTSLDSYHPYRDSDHADQLAAVNRIMSVVKECSMKSCCIESVMLYADGYSLVEIADILQIPVGTAKSRISSGRKMLRDALR